MALFAWSFSSVEAAQAEGTKKDPQYIELVREASREFDAGNFLEARTLFEQAHARKPSARTLRGLGSCAYELKHYVQATEELQSALDDTRNPLTAAQRSEVSNTLEKAKRFLGTLIVEVEPEGASVQVDGRPLEGRQVTLEAGDHSVSASASGYHGNEQTVTLAGGQRRTVRVELAPLELSPAVAARAQTDPAASAGRAPARADDSQSVFESWWFWTAVGVVVAGSAVGLALALNRGSETVGAYGGSTGVTLHAR